MTHELSEAVNERGFKFSSDETYQLDSGVERFEMRPSGVTYRDVAPYIPISSQRVTISEYYEHGQLVSMEVYPIFRLSKSKVGKRWVKVRQKITF